jgi:hypothetical protein
MSSELVALDENYKNEGEYIAIFSNAETLESLEETLSQLGGKYRKKLVYFNNADDKREGYLFGIDNLEIIKAFVNEINLKAKEIQDEEKEEEEESEEEKDEEEEESEEEKDEEKQESDEDEEKKEIVVEDELEEKFQRILKLVKKNKIRFDIEYETMEDLYNKVRRFYNDISLEAILLMINNIDTTRLNKFAKALVNARIRREKKDPELFKRNLERRKRRGFAEDRIKRIARMAEIKNRMDRQKFVLQKEVKEFFQYQQESKDLLRQEYILEIRPLLSLRRTDEKIKDIKSRMEKGKVVSDEEKLLLKQYETREKLYEKEFEKIFTNLSISDLERTIKEIENKIKFERPMNEREKQFYRGFKLAQLQAEYNVSKVLGSAYKDVVVQDSNALDFIAEQMDSQRIDKTPVKYKISKDEVNNYKKFGLYLSAHFLSSFLSCNEKTVVALLNNKQFVEKLVSALRNPTEYRDFIIYLQATKEFELMMEDVDESFQYLRGKPDKKDKLDEFIKEHPEFNGDMNEIAFVLGVPVKLIEAPYEKDEERFEKVLELFKSSVPSDIDNFKNELRSLRQKLCYDYIKKEKDEIETSKLSKYDMVLRNIIYTNWYKSILAMKKVSIYDFQFLCEYESLLIHEQKRYKELQKRIVEIRQEREEKGEEEEEKEEESDLEEEVEDVKDEAKVEREDEESDWEVKIGKVAKKVKIQLGDGTYTETIETVDGPIYVLKEYQTTYLSEMDVKEQKKKSIYDLMKDVSGPSKEDILFVRDRKLETLKNQVTFMRWYLSQAQDSPSDAQITAQLRANDIIPATFYEFIRLRDQDKLYIAKSIVDQYEEIEKKTQSAYRPISEMLTEDEYKVYTMPLTKLTDEQKLEKQEIEKKLFEDRKGMLQFLSIDVGGEIREMYTRTKPERKLERALYKQLEEEESTVFAEERTEEDEEEEEAEEKEEKYPVSSEDEEKREEDMKLAKQLFNEFSETYLTKQAGTFLLYDDLIKKFNDWMLRTYPTQPSIKLSLYVISEKIGNAENIVKKIGKREVRAPGFLNWKFEEKKEIKENYETFQDFSESAKIYDVKNIKYINFNKEACYITEEVELEKLFKRFNEDAPFISREFYNEYKKIWQKYNKDDVYKKVNLTRYTKIYLLNSTKLLRNPLIMNPFKRNRRLRLLREQQSGEQMYLARLPKNISGSTKECMIWSVIKPWLNKSFDYSLIGDAFGNKPNSLGSARKLFGQYDSTIEQNGKTIHLYRPTKYYHYIMCTLNTSEIHPACYSEDKDYTTINMDGYDVGLYTVLVNNVVEIDENNTYKQNKKYYVLTNKDYEGECKWWKTKQYSSPVILYNFKNQSIDRRSEFYKNLRAYLTQKLTSSVSAFYINYVENEIIQKEYKKRQQEIQNLKVDIRVKIDKEDYNIIKEQEEFNYFYNKLSNMYDTVERIKRAREDMLKAESGNDIKQIEEQIKLRVKEKTQKMKEEKQQAELQEFKKKKIEDLTLEMESIKIQKEKYFSKFPQIIIDLLFDTAENITYGALIRKYIVYSLAFSKLLGTVPKQFISFFYIDPTRINKTYLTKIFMLNMEECFPEIYLHPDSITRSLLTNYFTTLINNDVDDVLTNVYNKTFPKYPMLPRVLKDSGVFGEFNRKVTDVITNCKSLANSFSKKQNKIIWKNLKTNKILFFEIPTDRFFITLADFIQFLNSNMARYNLSFRNVDGKIVIINNSFDPIRLLNDEEASLEKSVEYTVNASDEKEEEIIKETGLCQACGLVHPNPKGPVTEKVTSSYASCFEAIKKASEDMSKEERGKFIQSKRSLLSKHQNENSKAQKLVEKAESQTVKTIVVSLFDSAMSLLGFTGDYTDTIISPKESFTAETSPQLFQKGDDLLTKYISSIPRERLISISTKEGDIICIDMMSLYNAKMERVKNKENLETPYLITVDYLDNPVEINNEVIDIITEVIQSTLYPARPLFMVQEEPLIIVCKHCKSHLKNDDKTFQTFEQQIHENEVITDFVEFCNSRCFDKYKEKGEQDFEEMIENRDFTTTFDIEFDHTKGNYRKLMNFLKIIITEEMFLLPEEKEEYFEKYFPDKSNPTIENLIEHIKNNKINIDMLLPYINTEYIIDMKRVIIQILPLFDVKDTQLYNKDIIDLFYKIMTSFDPRYSNMFTVDLPEEIEEKYNENAEQAILQEIVYSEEEFNKVFQHYLEELIRERDTDKFVKNVEQRTSIRVDIPHLDIYIDKIKETIKNTTVINDNLIKILQASHSNNFSNIEAFKDLLSDIFTDTLVQNMEEVNRAYNLVKSLRAFMIQDGEEEKKEEKPQIFKSFLIPRTEYAYDSKRRELIASLIMRYFKLDKSSVEKIHKNIFIDINNIFNNESYVFALEQFIEEIIKRKFYSIRYFKNNENCKEFIATFCVMIKEILGDNILQYRLDLSLNELENLLQYIAYSKQANNITEFEKYKKMLIDIFQLDHNMTEAQSKNQIITLASLTSKLKEYTENLKNNVQIQNLEKFNKNSKMTDSSVIQNLRRDIYEYLDTSLICNSIIEVNENDEVLVEGENIDYSVLENIEFFNKLNISSQDINILKTLSFLDLSYLDVVVLLHKIDQVLRSRRIENMEVLQSLEDMYNDLQNIMFSIIDKYQANEDLAEVKQQLSYLRNPARFNIYFNKNFLQKDIVYRLDRLDFIKNMIKRQFKITTPYIQDRLVKLIYYQIDYISEENFVDLYFSFIKKAENFLVTQDYIESPKLSVALYHNYKDLMTPFLIDNIFMKFYMVDRKILNKILCAYKNDKPQMFKNPELKQQFDFFNTILKFYKKWRESSPDAMEELRTEQQEIIDNQPDFSIPEYCFEKGLTEEELYRVKKEIYFNLYQYINLPSDIFIEMDGDFIILRTEEKSSDIIVKSNPDNVFYFTNEDDYTITAESDYYRTQLNPPTAENFLNNDFSNFHMTLENSFPETAYKGGEGYFSPKLANNVPTSTLEYNLDVYNHWGQRKLLLTEIDFLNQSLSRKNDIMNVIYAGSAHGTHIHILFKLFPNLKLHLYDPAVFDSILKPLVQEGKIIINEFYHSKKYKDLNINKDTPFNARKYRQNNLPEDYGFFTDEVAEYYKEKFYNDELGYSNCLFISDIRRDLPRNESQTYAEWSWEFEKIVLEDQEFMKNWLLILRPKNSMLKFKQPYVSQGRHTLYKYFQGDIRLQTWHPPNSAETRLLVSHENLDKEVHYNIISYERKTSYYNYLRTQDVNYTMPFINKSLSEFCMKVAPQIKKYTPTFKYFTIDFYNEFHILHTYFEKFSGEDVTDENTYIKLMRYITSVIDRTKKKNPDAFILKIKERE